MLVLVEKKTNSFRITRAKNKKNSISLSDFIQIWTGVLISLKEVSNTSKPHDIRKKGFLKIVLSTALVFAGLFLFYSNPFIIDIIWLILSLLGLSTGILIVQHEMGMNLKALNRFCKSFENSSCEAIIASD